MLSLLILLCLVAVLTLTGKDSMMKAERHWVGRARLATLRAFGLLLFLATGFLALSSQIRRFPDLPLVMLGCALFLCLPLYFVLLFCGFFVSAAPPEGDGTGLSGS